MLSKPWGIALPSLQSMLVPGAIGLLVVAAALISDHPEFENQLILGIEIAIGIALALLPFSYSQKSERDHKSQQQEIYSMAKRNEELERVTNARAARILHDSVNSLLDNCNGLIEMADRDAGASRSEWRRFRTDFLARHGAAAWVASVLSQTLTKAIYLDRQTYDDIAAAVRQLDGGVSIDDRKKTIDTAPYRAASVLLGPLLPRLKRSLGPATVRLSSTPGPAWAPALPGLLHLHLDCDTYPPGATVRARVEADGQFSGEAVTITILDESLAERDKKIKVVPEQEPGCRAVLVTDMSTKGLATGSTYTARAVCGGHVAEVAFAVDHIPPVVGIDKSPCMMGDDIVITVTDPVANTGRTRKKFMGDTKKSWLAIESPHGRIDGYRLKETGPSTGIFQGRVRCMGVRGDGTVRGDVIGGKYVDTTGGQGAEDGAIACGPNQTIRIRYASKSGVDTAAVIVRGFDSIIELDRRDYTCLDRVEICVVSPGLASGHGRLATAGDDHRDYWLTVSTGEGALGGYLLVESEPGSGVFMGAVSLTGLASMSGRKNSTVLGRGRTGGSGPRGGMLACGPEDELKVSFASTLGGTVHKTVPVRWRIGTIRFSNASYMPGEEIKVNITDPDMRLGDGKQNRFQVRVWSDSDRKGIPLTVRETAPDSGVFEGRFTTTPDRSLAEGPLLKAKDGDAVAAEYTDETLPHPYGHNNSIAIISAATVTTKRKLSSPLERLVIDGMRIGDRKTGGPTLVVGSDIEVEIRVKNPEREITFTAILQVSGLDGIADKILHRPLTARLNGHTTHAFSWTPARPGTYVATVFLWKSMDDPVAYSLPATREVQVLDPAAVHAPPEGKSDSWLPAGGSGDGGDGHGGGPVPDDREKGQACPLRRREQG